jgi:hypothetical protein
MATVPPFILFLWAISVGVQLTVLCLLISKRHFHSLPLFSIYIVLNLCQAAFLYFIYSQFGYYSHVARQMFWISEPITLAAQTLAATEVLFRALQAYSGIWGLAWRLIAAAVVVVVCYAAASAGQTPEWRLMIADRGYHLTFAIALISCLLLVRFYSIPVDPVYKTLLAGFCVFSCFSFVANTVLQALFQRHYPGSSDIWNYLEMLVFIVVQIVWAVALRHPVPAEARPTLLPPSTYDRLSPQVNARLRALNDLLSRLWRLEVLRP